PQQETAHPIAARRVGPLAALSSGRGRDRPDRMGPDDLAVGAEPAPRKRCCETGLRNWSTDPLSTDQATGEGSERAQLAIPAVSERRRHQSGEHAEDEVPAGTSLAPQNHRRCDEATHCPSAE